MIKVTDQNCCFIIEWDPDDPVERVFNSWTEKDFIKVIMDACIKVLEDSKEEDDPMAK